MVDDFAPSTWNLLSSEKNGYDFWKEEFSVCRQVRRTCIDEVNAIFDFLAITAKQVSGRGMIKNQSIVK
jgi:hypothetical protein